MTGLPGAADLDRRAAASEVELGFGRHEVLDDLEPLWLALLDHHVEIGAAGLPVVSADLSWTRRRRFYEGLLAEPEATIVTALAVVVGNVSAIAFYERRGMAPITVNMLRMRSEQPR